MHTYCILMFWPIDSRQNRVPADQYHLTVFFEVIRWQVISFQVIAGSSSIFFKILMKYVVFTCRTLKILISKWPRTRKFSELLPAGKTVTFDFSHYGHTATLYVQFLCSSVKIWQVSSCGKFMQHLESTCDVFNCLFPLDVQNEIRLLSGVFCHSWLVCLLGFWLRNTSLNCQSRKSDFWWHPSCSFSPCLMRKRVA